MKHKFFNGRKYYFDLTSNRWYRTTIPIKVLSHDVWNYHYPSDPILKDEVIHHKNGDSSDDRIENLQKMKQNEHSRMHNIGKQYTLGKHWSDEHKHKISKAMIGKQSHLGKHHTNEAKQKMRDAQLGHIVTDEVKQKMSDSQLGKLLSDEVKQKLRKANLGDKNPNWKGGRTVIK